jgi:hypothetical protein
MVLSQRRSRLQLCRRDQARPFETIAIDGSIPQVILIFPLRVRITELAHISASPACDDFFKIAGLYPVPIEGRRN